MVASGPQQTKSREGVILALNVAIEAMNLAKDVSSIPPAKAVFGSVSFVLTMIRVSFLLARVDRLRAEMDPGLDDKPGGLRRTRAGLR